MLDPQSYQTAWIAYIAATLLALLILYLWIGSRWSVRTRLSWAMLLGALALAPAHPEADTATWAPALFVAAFETLTEGTEAAMRPLRSVLAGLGFALGVSLLIFTITGLLSRRGSAAPADND